MALKLQAFMHKQFSEQKGVEHFSAFSSKLMQTTLEEEEEDPGQ